MSELIGYNPGSYEPSQPATNARTSIVRAEDKNLSDNQKLTAWKERYLGYRKDISALEYLWSGFRNEFQVNPNEPTWLAKQLGRVTN